MVVSGRTPSRALRWTLALTLGLCPGLAPRALGADFSAYQGWVKAAGDVHQHAAGYALAPNIAAGNEAAIHEHGWPPALWTRMRVMDYQWGNLSTHDFSIGSGAASSAAAWWRSPASRPVLDPWTGAWIVPDSRGFQFTDASDPWNESTARSRAAIAATTPSFAAFAGREFTTIQSIFRGSCVGCPSGGCPLCGGHKLAIPLREATTLCSAFTALVAQVDRCPSEGDLYEWISELDGVLIQAHPEGGSPGPLFDPLTAPGGFSDLYVQGMEVGSEWFNWSNYQSYLQALQAGYRLFPAFGSDDHFPAGILPERGATICWADSLSREAVIGAMKARRCYYAKTARPTLRFEASAVAGGAASAMGGLLSLPGRNGSVRAQAKNDPRAQALASPQRFERIELVDATGQVLRACGLGGTDPNCRCTARADGDECWLRADGLQLLGPADTQDAVHVRVCRVGECAVDLYERVLAVSAPVFLNWVACDVDRDRVACQQDVCPSFYDPTQPDDDRDGYGDGCDICPKVFDEQADGDGDGIGDACDVCPEVPDLAQGDADGDGSGNACDPCPILASHAADADHDGTPDRCDNCQVSNPDQLDSDGDRAGDVCDPDDDRDGILDFRDNCPYARNTVQADRGGFGESTRDGIGDACQCGDVDGSGIVDVDDAVTLLLPIQSGNTTHPALSNPLCDVDEDRLCTLADVNRLLDLLVVSGSPAPQTCAPALPSAAPDRDGDQIADWLDNCPAAFNPSQADRGRVASALPDGIGDACQCGDVNGSGSVTATDALLIDTTILGLAPCLAGPVTQPCLPPGLWFLSGRCDVSGDASCSTADSMRISRATIGLSPGIVSTCPGEDLPTFD